MSTESDSNIVISASSASNNNNKEEGDVKQEVEEVIYPKDTEKMTKDDLADMLGCSLDKEAPIKDKKEIAIEAKTILEKFKSHITSNKFDKQCETAAKKHGVSKNIVKNKVVKGFLASIAEILGLVIVITGDILMSAVNFIAFIINKIAEFAVDNIIKLVNLLTLNSAKNI